MKVRLKGTITEERIKTSILSMTKTLLSLEDGKKVIKLIESKLGKITSFYVVAWIEGQGDNLYSIIVNGQWHVILELDEDEEEPIEFSIKKLEDCQVGLGTLIVLELIKEGNSLINNG